MQSDSTFSFKSMLKWVVIWCGSSTVLFWRIFDFIDESLHEGFHSTRAGLAIYNDQAAVFQLLVIISCLGIVWIATSKIIHLIKTFPSSSQ